MQFNTILLNRTDGNLMFMSPLALGFLKLTFNFNKGEKNL